LRNWVLLNSFCRESAAKQFMSGREAMKLIEVKHG